MASKKNKTKTTAAPPPAVRADARRGARPPAIAPKGPGRFTTWVEAHRRWLLVGILVLAGLLRVTYLAQANPGPLVRMHLWDQTDMNYYDFWANRIIGGDFLCRDVPPPMHGWHRDVARAYLKENPNVLAELAAQVRARNGEGFDPERELWVRWLGPRRYYQEPLYPYLLALSYSVFGHSQLAVFMWQMVIGMASILLVYAISRRYFDTVIALVAALLATLSSVLLMHELLLLRDTLIVFAGLLVLWLTSLAVERRTWYWWAATGAALGMALMLKGIFNVCLVGLLPLIVILCWRKWKAMAVSAAALVGGLLLAQAPLMARNLAVGVPPTALAGNAALAFIQNNAADYRWYGTDLVSPDSVKLLGKSEGKLLPGIVESLKTHPNIGSVLLMVWSKFDAAWHWWERADNANIYNYQLYAPVLGWLLPFTLLAPPALLGLGLGLRHFWRRYAMYLMVATGLAPLVIFNIQGRFRLIMIAATIPFAAFALVQIVRWLAQRRFLKALPAIIVLGLLPFWTARPLTGYDYLKNAPPGSVAAIFNSLLPSSPGGFPLLRGADVGQSYLVYYEPKRLEAMQAGKPAEAAAMIRDYLRHEPGLVRDMGPVQPAQNPGEAQIGMWYGQLHYQLAQLLQGIGDSFGAQVEMGQATRIQTACQRFLGPPQPQADVKP